MTKFGIVVAIHGITCCGDAAIGQAREELRALFASPFEQRSAEAALRSLGFRQIDGGRNAGNFAARKEHCGAKMIERDPGRGKPTEESVKKGLHIARGKRSQRHHHAMPSTRRQQLSAPLNHTGIQVSTGQGDKIAQGVRKRLLVISHIGRIADNNVEATLRQDLWKRLLPGKYLAVRMRGFWSIIIDSFSFSKPKFAQRITYTQMSIER